jgi:ribose transport system ATP-binding protein
VAQNIFLGREPVRAGVVDDGRMAEETARILGSLRAEAGIAPGTLVRNLSVAQQQTVEIAKALSYEARVLVMDEPTCGSGR